MSLLAALVCAANTLLAFLTGYLLWLAAAALRAPRTTALWPRPARQHFAVVIPAHNEARLLPGLLASLREQTYPAERYDVHVIADNCTDETPQVARQAGALVHERCDPAHAGKGYALNWLFDGPALGQSPHTAVVFLDADSIVSPNFLAVMAARLDRGQQAIQAYYAARDPERSTAIGLRYAALAALHYLRPLGRMVLGGSAGLKGNGMVLTTGLMRRCRWSASVTEDIELHMALLLAGVRVHFAPDAVVQGEMPDALSRSVTQHQRWESGRLQLARRYVPQLARAAWRQGLKPEAFALLDAAMEHLIPPFSVLAGASLLLLVGGAALAVVAGPAAPMARLVTRLNVGLGAAVIAGQLVYLLAALHLVRAPRRVYWQLLSAPVYMAWKLNQYARTLLRHGTSAWVRTARNEGT